MNSNYGLDYLYNSVGQICDYVAKSVNYNRLDAENLDEQSTEEKLIETIQKNPINQICQRNSLLGEGGAKEIYAIKNHTFVLVKFRSEHSGHFENLKDMYEVFHDKLLIGTPFKTTDSEGDIYCILMPRMQGDIWVWRQKIESKGSIGQVDYKNGKDNILYYLKNEPVNRVLDFALMVCNDLKTLHDENWVHGDIHPSNILFSITGYFNPKLDQVRLSDFDTTVPVQEGEVCEAPQGRTSKYAPEIKETRKYTGPDEGKQIDIYCLGHALSDLFLKVEKGEIKDKINNLTERMSDADPSKRPKINAIIEELQSLQEW